MKDIHCHILPDVDDGAANLSESLAMLEAAKAAGVTSIVCTPHVRDPYFDFDMMWDAYHKLVAASGGFDITMGFEVNWNKLQEIGEDEWLPLLYCDGPSYVGNGTHTILLELSNSAKLAEYNNYAKTIRKCQALGYDVVIAHPERYHVIQNDIEVARKLKQMGCKLQASADFIAGGRMGKEKRPAKKMFKAGLYDFIASDAHYPEHYKLLEKACRKFKLPDNIVYPSNTVSSFESSKGVVVVNNNGYKGKHFKV